MIKLINKIYKDDQTFGFLDCGGIGDRIKFTMFPENWYHVFGKKLINLTKSYVYYYNPYVVSGDKASVVLDLHYGFMNFKNHKIDLKKIDYSNGLSFGEKCCNMVGIECILRNPKLYIHENESIFLDRIILHGHGSTVGRLPNYIIEHIFREYKSFQIIQIGSKDEPLFCGKIIDARGKSFFDTVRLIATSAIFIGINSGFYHVANCYNRIRKKIILFNLNKEKYKKIIPMNESTEGSWYDFGIEYFNDLEYDCGITKSYLKI